MKTSLLVTGALVAAMTVSGCTPVVNPDDVLSPSEPYESSEEVDVGPATIFLPGNFEPATSPPFAGAGDSRDSNDEIFTYDTGTSSPLELVPSVAVIVDNPPLDRGARKVAEDLAGENQTPVEQTWPGATAAFAVKKQTGEGDKITQLQYLILEVDGSVVIAGGGGKFKPPVEVLTTLTVK